MLFFLVGLDPALPFFATLNDGWKLDADDAEFVDIIHSNSGIYGKIEATGHVDFYMNGGTFQPACTNNRSRYILRGNMWARDFFFHTTILAVR